ncbi:MULTISPECIES: AzlD domain-containing protein [unclassified Bradyrhizobium]|uniref:AzlD domain-containing protein n=1 Tax=unclassified Bradyrhizobium TaxID=2631580 RepID=UPI002915FACE|nr:MULTISPECIES: AzlD domain-containing protein [unclassified Bradyrhizobium]
MIVLVVVAVLPNEIWRWAAIIIAEHLRDDSPFFGWVRYIAMSLVAGVVAQLLWIPGGTLADASPGLRVAALLLGVCAWQALGRRIALGWLVGVLALVTGVSLR